MKVLITGAGGQLGHDLQEAFADDKVIALDRAALDVTREADVQAALADHRPDLVLHSAAFTKVDACESEPETAWQVNTTTTWWVARACAATGAAMVYLSSDYVFDGMLGRPYTEFDRVNPRSVYGRTKEAGEQVVRQVLDRHYIVRTSWVLGAHGGNFAKTMLRLGAERGAVSIVDDQCGSPTFTADLAPQLRRLAMTGRHGTYHLTNSGHCTWFELAHEIFQQAGLSVDLTPTDTETFGAPAHRPAYSVLDNLMARQVGLPEMPAWRESLKRLLGQIT